MVEGQPGLKRILTTSPPVAEPGKWAFLISACLPWVGLVLHPQGPATAYESATLKNTFCVRAHSKAVISAERMSADTGNDSSTLCVKKGKTRPAVSACGPCDGVTSPRTILDLRVSFGVEPAPWCTVCCAWRAYEHNGSAMAKALRKVIFSVLHEGLHNIHRRLDPGTEVLRDGAERNRPEA